MAKASDIISNKYNRPESKYGSTRSTLFGKFYERIISKWLEEMGYSLERWRSGAVHKPRIYWKSISLDMFDFSGGWFSREEVEESLETLKSERRYCTLDGVFKRSGEFYIWEAKNWPLFPEKGPKPQIKKYLTAYPWIFAKKFDLSGKEYEISGFLFSFWYMTPEDKREIEEGVNRIIGENRFKIILTRELLDECINEQYDWYREIIKQERANIYEFFDQLLGEK